MLDKTVDLLCQTEKSKKLKYACRTRWIQRIDSYAVFLELMSAVAMALLAIVCPCQCENLHNDWNWVGETITKAIDFLHILESASFFVAFKIILEVLLNLRGLTPDGGRRRIVCLQRGY